MSFLVKFKLFCLLLVLSDSISSLSVSFFLKGHKVLDVINICCYCCLILLFVKLAFLILTDLIILRRNLFPLNYLRWRQSLLIHIFSKNTSTFGLFYLLLIW